MEWSHFWSGVFGAIGGGATFTALIAILANKIISHRLSKDLQVHKNELELELQKHINELIKNKELLQNKLNETSQLLEEIKMRCLTD